MSTVRCERPELEKLEEFRGGMLPPPLSPPRYDPHISSAPPHPHFALLTRTFGAQTHSTAGKSFPPGGGQCGALGDVPTGHRWRRPKVLDQRLPGDRSSSTARCVARWKVVPRKVSGLRTSGASRRSFNKAVFSTANPSRQRPADEQAAGEPTLRRRALPTPPWHPTIDISARQTNSMHLHTAPGARPAFLHPGLPAGPSRRHEVIA
ncbi:MAG: hypothetical protein PWR21_1736 [Methanoculleus sp.]|nr:hypothetical protein [Methanoculleus sp.]